MSNATFTAGGRTWRAGFTDETEAAALHELNVPLADLARMRPERLVDGLGRDPLALGGLLYLACRGECEARGLTPEAFAAQFNYATLPAATVALFEAVAERFPDSRLAAGMRKYRRG